MNKTNKAFTDSHMRMSWFFRYFNIIVTFFHRVNDCPSATQIAKDFTRMRKDFNARYVRIYAACDTSGFYDRIVTAAYNAGLGVYAVIWFG